MKDYVARTLGALATVVLFACDSPATSVSTTSTEPQPAPFSELKNRDCAVKILHDFLYETIMNYDGQHGLHVISPMTIEARTTRMRGVSGFVGHDRVNGMYFRGEGSSARYYFSDDYIPNGDNMACDLAERLLAVAKSQREVSSKATK